MVVNKKVYQQNISIPKKFRVVLLSSLNLAVWFVRVSGCVGWFQLEYLWNPLDKHQRLVFFATGLQWFWRSFIECIIDIFYIENIVNSEKLVMERRWYVRRNFLIKQMLLYPFFWCILLGEPCYHVFMYKRLLTFKTLLWRFGTSCKKICYIDTPLK